MLRSGLGRRRGTDAARSLRTSAALALAMLAHAMLPSLAGAASVSVSKEHDRLEVVAAAGERNALSVSAAAGVYTITDQGSPISAGTGCASLSPGTATCVAVPGGPIGYLLVSAGDGDDSVIAATTVPAYVDAGAGADVVKSGATADLLYGAGGDDVLEGGLGGDMIAGGDGHDRADYSSRTAALVVGIDGAAGDGAAGENDNVTSSIEEIAGGGGDDRLTGSGGSNVLSGGGGNDILSGGAGDDLLDGGSGQDLLEGGADADVLRSADDEADDDRCGAGPDTVFENSSDTVAADCETRRTTAAPGVPGAGPGATLDLLPKAVRLTGDGSLRVRVYCALAAGICTGRVTADVITPRKRRVRATSTTTMLARGTAFSVRAGESKIIKVTISRNGRRRVIREKRANCRVRAVIRSSGRTTTARKTVVVKAPRKRSGR
jgi:hypothetical protein